MSILIKGAKLPSGCAFCYFNVDSKCALIPGCNYDETNGWQRRDDCPLVELPEHGDLIDRDALNATDSWEWIRHATPVFIPAERSDDGDWSIGKMGEKQAENAAAEAWNRRAERSFSPVMPITNADRIRQMSDDELATLFGDACACLYDDADVCEKWGGACDRCWLDWLKKEVSDAELD